MSDMIDIAVHESRPGSCVIAVTGELDIVSASEVRDALRAAMATHRDVVVNLAHLEFCDCSGLNALLSAAVTAKDSGVDLRLCEIPHCLARLLLLSGTPEALVIEPVHWHAPHPRPPC